MSQKPIFVVTHPRACSTAFERVFMTQRDTLECFHEPFGDAFYYGAERLSPRYGQDEETREKSGHTESTYRSVFDRVQSSHSRGKRAFIKDMAYYIVPPQQQSPSIAPSMQKIKRGVGTEGANDSAVFLNGESKAGTSTWPYNTAAEPGNPTVIPKDCLEKFHFTFLIRHPRSSIPSYLRCCSPPLVNRTGFNDFLPEEAGYDELRRFFDYSRENGFIGPEMADQDGASKPAGKGVEICIIDADDLLDDPEGVLRKYCKSVGLDFSPSMLVWDDEDSQQYARDAFAKWDGWHDDALNSKDLKPRAHKKVPKSDEQLYADWQSNFGQEAADVIKKTISDNVADYEYLKQFAIKP